MLRKRSYLSEMNSNSQFSYRGQITDWGFTFDDGETAAQKLRTGKAKLVKGNGGRVYLKVSGGKEWKVKAALAKGILEKFWVKA